MASFSDKKFQVYNYCTGGVLQVAPEGVKDSLAGDLLPQFRLFPFTKWNSLASILIAKSIVADSTISKTSPKAPDHLLHLYSFNQELENIGCNYFNKEFINNEMIKEASPGNVATPVSGLIVPESL